MTERTARQVVDGLTQEQKIRLLSGRNFWNTEALPDVPSVLLTDGPHGVRKQVVDGDQLGLAASVPATCFPPAAGLGATWDMVLLEEVGGALGREAAAQGVGVLLGPGLNIKRHPGGGRNFEYFSEDPLLSGKAAAAMVRGIQAEGVGASLKHFAVNNQESQRMRLDTVVDERTLRELYLTGFEIALAEADPWTVMSSYNKLNGEHTGESHWLLTEVLRDEWGFEGLVVSDWLAVADRVVGVRAGLDLEMPGSGGSWDGRLRAALAEGRLSSDELDTACTRVVELAHRVAAARRARADVPVDADHHHALARRAAAAATVLLTNDGILPLAPGGRVALVGEFAARPRFQGAGSSLVNPTRVDTLLDALRARLGSRTELEYVPGYDATTGAATPEQIAEARRAAADADVVVLVVGLPATYESEGFDRTDLRLPASHDALVGAVTSVNPRTVVVLVNGAPVELPWAEKPAALLEAYLGGQAGGSALADVLTGDVEPGGRLAESFPVTALELPAHANFANHPTQVEYRETLHVGYRFHDTYDVAPRFCFGHGLGYTTFELTDLDVRGEGTDRTVHLTVENTGPRSGSTVIQVYVHDVESSVPRPEQELRAFEKVFLAQGEVRRVRIPIGRRAFALYDATAHGWLVEAGEYEVRVGLSSRDVRLSKVVEVASDDVVTPVTPTAGAVASDVELVRLLGRSVPTPRPLVPFHEDSTIADLDGTWLGRRLRSVLVAQATRRVDVGDADAGSDNSTMLEAVIDEMPLRGVVMASGGKLPFAVLERGLTVLNAVRRR